MIDKLGGRKVVVAVIVFVTGMIVTAIKGDVPPNLLQLLSIVFGAFVVGNVGEYVSGAFTSKALNLQADAVSGEQFKLEVASLHSALDEVRTASKQNSDGTAAVQQALSLIISKYGIDK